MLEQGVFSEDKHFMVMMHQLPRSLLARPAIVCQNGATAYAVVLERTRKQSERRRQRSLSKGKLQSRYMLLKTLKREFQVGFTYEGLLTVVFIMYFIVTF